MHPDDLTPYLGLRARLSQVWINRWTILLLLVLVRVLLAIGSIQSDMASAKREALVACTSVENMGSAMASMPHYLSEGVNELTATGIDKAAEGLKSMLLLTITGVEEIIIFIIKIMYQTYLCLITLAVRGSVHVAVGLIEDAAHFVNSTLKTISQDIDSTVNTFETGLQNFANAVNTAASLVGAHLPTLDLNKSLNELENIQLPSSIDTTLNNLNNSVPTFNEVNNFVQSVIKLPFEEVKKLVDESLGTYTFDRSVLPVPQKKQLTFCNNNNGINSFFNGVTDIAITARKIFIAIILIAATLVCIPVAWQEIRRWRQMKERSQLVRKEAHDPMDVVYIVSRPYTAAAGIKAASRFSNSRRQILVRWAIAYATSTPALFVLALAIAGLFSCLCQYVLLRSIKTAVPALTTQVTQFANEVVGSLQNTSAEWANGANTAITHTNNEINNNIFGWVNTSTTAVNKTLNTFVDKTTDVLNQTLGGTPLYTPLMDVFKCLIGLKIEGIQDGLTWVSDHAYIDFPLLPSNTFSTGAAGSIANINNNPSNSFLANKADQTSNQVSEVVNRVIKKLEDGLRTETLIAAAILGIWVFVALIGAMRAILLFWGRDRPRGDGGGHAMEPVSHAPHPNGFSDVPLTTIPRDMSDSAPEERYDSFAKTGTANGVPVRNAPSAGENEKHGFAGQRNYDSALQVDSARDFRGSSYVEYDVKR